MRLLNHGEELAMIRGLLLEHPLPPVKLTIESGRDETVVGLSQHLIKVNPSISSHSALQFSL